MEARPRPREPQDQTLTESLIPTLISLVACGIVFLVPFFPDEKLIRLKLEALELGIFSMSLLVGIHFILNRQLRISFASPDRPILQLSVLLWLVINCVLYFFSSEKSLASSEIRRITLASAALLAFSLGGMSEGWRRRFLLSWCLAGGLLALYGILQHTGGFLILDVPRMDRVMGTYGNPIFFASYLVPTFFLCLQMISEEKSPLMRSLVGWAGGLQIIACYATQTRAAWIALVVCFVVGLMWSSALRRVPAWAWVGLLLLVGIGAVKSKPVWARDQGHMLIWRDTLRMWKDNPILGVGLGTFHTNFPTYAQEDLKSKWPKGEFIVNDAHNEYLQTMAETGLIGLISFLSIPIVFFFVHRQRSWLAAGVLAIYVQNFFSVDMQFGISLANAFILMGFATPSPRQSEVNLDPGQKHAGMTKLKIAGATVWTGLLVLFILPQILKPYRAQREIAATPGFFNERLLDPAKTLADLEKLRDQYPSESRVLEKLAYAYSKEIMDPAGRLNKDMAEKAINTYAALLLIDLDSPAAPNNLANVYYTIGNSNEAIKNWEKAVARDPEFVDAHLNLGKVLYVRGDLKESAAHFEKVLKIDPGNNEAIVYLKRMVE